MAEASYIDQLNEKLAAARKRVRQGREVKALKASAPTLFEIIDGEAHLIYTKTFGDKPLPYDEYLSAHGEMRGIKRIRNLIDSKELEEAAASQEVEAIQDNLKNMQNGKKPE